jgi:hypothetical protein
MLLEKVSDYSSLNVLNITNSEGGNILHTLARLDLVEITKLIVNHFREKYT